MLRAGCIHVYLIAKVVACSVARACGLLRGGGRRDAKNPEIRGPCVLPEARDSD